MTRNQFRALFHQLTSLKLIIIGVGIALMNNDMLSQMIALVFLVAALVMTLVAYHHRALADKE
jgi:hypothetical protein